MILDEFNTCTLTKPEVARMPNLKSISGFIEKVHCYVFRRRARASGMPASPNCFCGGAFLDSLFCPSPRDLWWGQGFVGGAVSCQSSHISISDEKEYGPQYPALEGVKISGDPAQGMEAQGSSSGQATCGLIQDVANGS